MALVRSCVSSTRKATLLEQGSRMWGAKSDKFIESGSFAVRILGRLTTLFAVVETNSLSRMIRQTALDPWGPLSLIPFPRNQESNRHQTFAFVSLRLRRGHRPSAASERKETPECPRLPARAMSVVRADLSCSYALIALYSLRTQSFLGLKKESKAKRNLTKKDGSSIFTD